MNCDLLIHEIADAPQPVIEKNPKIQGLMNYHTTPEEMDRILNRVKPRLTILTHILALGGITPDEILTKIKTSTKYKFRIELAHDLMAVDVKEKFYIYSIDH